MSTGDEWLSPDSRPLDASGKLLAQTIMHHDIHRLTKLCDKIGCLSLRGYRHEGCRQTVEKRLSHQRKELP